MSELPILALWLDPGATTGWAAYYLHFREGYKSGLGFSCGQGKFLEIGQLLEDWAFLHEERMSIGWEQYIVTPGGGRTGTAAPPLEMIGAAKWIAHFNHCRLLKPVPSAMRTVATPDMLKRLGWYRPGQDHAMQAARHLLAWLIREKLLSPEQHEVLFG